MLWRVSILLILGLFDVVLFSRMIWGPTGIMEYRELKRQHQALKEEIASLDAKNLAISREIRLLQSDDKYVEKMVRQKLHYLRDNEVVYLFASPVNDSAGATSDDGKN